MELEAAEPVLQALDVEVYSLEGHNRSKEQLLCKEKDDLQPLEGVSGPVSGSSWSLGSHARRTCRSRTRQRAAIVNTRTWIGWNDHWGQWEYLTLTGLGPGIVHGIFQSWSIRWHILFRYIIYIDDSFCLLLNNFTVSFNSDYFFFFFTDRTVLRMTCVTHKILTQWIFLKMVRKPI